MWGDKSPAPGVPVDEFSIRWIGYVRVPKAGRYRFTVIADDRARVIVDRRFKIPAIHFSENSRPASNSIALPKGYAEIRFEFVEEGWGAGAELYWSSPDIPLEIIPASHLVHTPEQEAIAKSDPYTLGERGSK